MYPSQHIIIGILFSSICLILFPSISLFGISLIFLSSVLIDVDHYIYYVYKKKDFSLKNSHKWFLKSVNKVHSLPLDKRKDVYTAFCFLHGLDIFTIVLLLAFFSKYFFFIFIGFLLHLFLDIVYEEVIMTRKGKIFAIHDFFKFKKFKFIEDVK